MKRSNDHTKAAILFIVGAIALGVVIFAAIKFAGSLSPQATANDTRANEETSAFVSSELSNSVDQAEVAQVLGSDDDGALPTDQDKTAMLVGNSFSDQVSSGNGYCYGDQATFDNVGTDGVQSVTISNPAEGPDLSALWDIRGGKLLLTLLNEGDEEAGNPTEVTTVDLKVWANGKGNPNAKEMSESGQIQIGSGPILTYCRQSE